MSTTHTRTTQLEPPAPSNGVKLTKSKQASPGFDGALIEAKKWWASLAKEWKSVVLILTSTVMVFVLNNPIYNVFYSIALASIFYLIMLRKLSPAIGEQRWSIPVFHALLMSLLLSNPVMAQATNNTNACTNNGLFANVTNFVNTIFSSITFGGIGGGTLSNLICQVIGFVVVSLALGFIGVIATVSYQVGYQNQPVSAVVNPVFGFLIFAGGSTVVITILIGTASTGIT